MRTMTFARQIVRIACHQFMPSSIKEDANMYVGTHAARATHKAARSFKPQVRWVDAVGARSGLMYPASAAAAKAAGGLQSDSAKLFRGFHPKKLSDRPAYWPSYPTPSLKRTNCLFRSTILGTIPGRVMSGAVRKVCHACEPALSVAGQKTGSFLEDREYWVSLKLACQSVACKAQ